MDSDDDIYSQKPEKTTSAEATPAEVPSTDVSSTEATPAEATSQEAQNEEIIDSIYNQDNEMTQSIYEENSVHPTTDPSARAKPTEPSEFTFSAAEKKLSYIGGDSEFIPNDLINDFGLKTLVLDLSFNCINDLTDLQQFPVLEELICDNNTLDDATNYPKLDSLKIFSCNKNRIENIQILVEKIKISFPNLTYLSLMGNQACPNQLVDETKDEYDYSKYRKYVLSRLKSLKILDCYEVTQQEREKIQQEEHIYEVVTLKDDPVSSSGVTKNAQPKNSKYTPLPGGTKADEIDEAQGSFGYCKYVYYGKQSEGNRFIRNDDL